QFMVQNNLTKETLVYRAEDLSFPKSIVEFMQALFDQPPYGFRKLLRRKVLRGKDNIYGRSDHKLSSLDLDAVKKDLENKHGRTLREVDVMSY
ncbi:hypothetical protein PFISCL1PPCAC_1759, partial [Pristionchus fissidentatus]